MEILGRNKDFRSAMISPNGRVFIQQPVTEASSHKHLSDSELRTIDLKMTQGRVARLRLLSLNGSLPQEAREDFEKIIIGNEKSAYVSFSTVSSDHDPYPPLNSSPQQLISQFSEGLTAMNTLVERYLPFAKWVASERVNDLGYRKMGLTFEDIYGYAVWGLVEAAAKFGYRPGLKFTSYAYERVKGRVIDELREISSVPRRTAKRINEVREALDQITSEGLRIGGLSLDQELERRTGLGRSALSFVLQLVEVGTKAISLDALSDNPGADKNIDEFSSWLDAEALVDKDFNPEQILVNHELSDGLIQAIRYLSPRERLVLSLYYGDEELSLREIGDRLGGVSESRVCQIHRKALEQLREVFAKDDFKAFLF